MAEKKKTQWTRYESTAPRTFREAAAKASKKSTAKRRVTTHSTTTADAASRRNSTPAWQKAVDADLRKRGFDPSKFTTAQKRSFLQGGAAPVNKSTGLGRGGVFSDILDSVGRVGRSILDRPASVTGGGLSEHWMNPANRLPGAELRASLPSSDGGGGGGGAITDGISYDLLAGLDPSLYDIDVEGLYNQFKLPTPDESAYLEPYKQARAAADSTYQAGKGEISAADAALRQALSVHQAEGQGALAARDRERLLRREQLATEQGTDLATTGLAADMGLGDEMGQQAALLRMVQQQANLGGDNLAAEIQSGQERNFNDRVQSADQQQSAAFANAALNLQAILQQIAGGEADAKRQFASDTASVNRENLNLRSTLEGQDRDLQRHLGEIKMGAAEKQADIERENRRLAEEQQRADQQYADAQIKLAQGFEKNKWDANAALRWQNNPQAMRFFDEFVGNLRAKRDGSGKGKALSQLGAALTAYQQATGVRLNGDVIRNVWIPEYFDNITEFDEQGFLAAGGDPSMLR